ncbi:MAG: hypothetical protein L0387_20720 [Acidobacteria bacterium]|nr:hypothetical protein [Acidobacteriota bacterium]
MKVGTKSLLLGAHCVLLHPFFVFWAWKRLFGVPRDPRIFFACVLHDIGYFQRDSMDGPHGEEHVILGARIMGWLFGPAWADEYKLCGIWSAVKGFFPVAPRRQAGEGGAGEGGSAALFPRISNAEVNGDSWRPIADLPVPAVSARFTETQAPSGLQRGIH